MKCLNSTLLAAAAAASLLFVVPAQAQTDPVVAFNQSIAAQTQAYADAIQTNSDDNVIVLGPSHEGHYVHPTTTLIADYSQGRRLVHVSGVVMVDGQPVPGARVDLRANLPGEGGFGSDRTVAADARGVYNAWFQSPTAIQNVDVTVPAFCSTGTATDCDDSWDDSEHATVIGSGACGDDDECERQAYVTGTASIGVGELP